MTAFMMSQRVLLFSMFAVGLILAPGSQAAAKPRPARPVPVTEVDPQWKEFLDKDVVVSLASGAGFIGQVVGVEASGLTLKLGDGSTRTVALEEVSEIHARSTPPPAPPPPPPPASYLDAPERASGGGREVRDDEEPRSGRGLLITGSTVFTVGAVWLSAGLGVMLSDACLTTNSYYNSYGDYWTNYSGYDSACEDAGIAVLSVGAVHMAAAVPMIVVGAKRQKQWKAWREQRVAFRPALKVTGRSWGVGLRVMF